MDTPQQLRTRARAALQASRALDWESLEAERLRWEARDYANAAALVEALEK